MQTPYLYALRFILAVSDLILINICLFLGFYLANKYYVAIDMSVYRSNVFTSSIIWLLSTGIFRLYSEDTIHKLEYIYRSTWKSIALHGFFFLSYLLSTDHADSLRYFIFIFYTMMVIGFLLSRFTGTAFEGLFKRNFDTRKIVAVLGMNRGGLKLAAYLEQQSSFNFVGFLGEENYYVDENGQLLAAAAEQFKTAANSNIKEVYVSLTPERMRDVGYLLKEAEKQCVRLKFVPDLDYAAAPFYIEHMGGFPILSVRREPLEDMGNRFKKRFFDIIFSSLVIVFILSWLYPIIALIIKLQSPGPVIFKQQRSGRDNKPFWCYKFRSMTLNNKSETEQAKRNDCRITPIGRFMRKTSIDELPQFFNVLLGDMSVVGPRPHMVDHTEQYRAIIDQYMVRQFLKSGITGWAQVKGYRGETKEHHLMEKRVEHDIWYMEHWSSMLDVRIIFMTIINILKGEDNAY
ncbi:MAG TPA: undecaprenyl-phosphate glucose phosphotransferase [Mucilaginibacter sp.]|jgi:putative colanic acid biosynthesis UDP-glucose lipid carrier transferase